MDALIKGFQLSEVPISIFNDKEEIVCMLGCCPTNIHSTAIVWLLASEDLKKDIPLRFLRHSKGVVEIFQKRYRVLYNFIDARNTLHIKWLKWCGFTFIQKHYDYGYEKYTTPKKTFEGVINNLERRYLETDSDWMREEISQYQSDTKCERCKGYRLKEEALCVKIDDQNISQVSEKSIYEARNWFKSLETKFEARKFKCEVICAW